LAAIDTIETLLTNTPATKSAFLDDLNARDASLLRLLDVGEQLSGLRKYFPDFYDAHADEAWKNLIAIRNIIAHGYRSIDFDIVWNVLAAHLSGVQDRLRTVAEEAANDNGAP
jgi:uncharacterized protein with HEPN domain